MKNRWKIPAAGLGVLLVVAVAVIVGRAALVESKQTDVEPVEVQLDQPDAMVERFARSLQYRTVAPEGPDDPTEPFVQLRRMLEDEFPAVHEKADRRLVGDLTLHFVVEGSDPEAAEVVFLAHQDVVPVERETVDRWEYPPFSGAVQEGFVWGRGALDNKHNMMAMLEALEGRLADGEDFEQTVHFVFGHDEEIGGRDGARRVGRQLEEREADVAAVFDEGLVIADGMVPGVDEPVALVGIAERGYVTVEVVASGPEGHASMPPADPAIVRLAEAISAIDANPRPAAVDGAIAEMFEWTVAEMGFGHRLIFANLWLFEPVVVGQMTDTPSTNAAVRTTAAPTMLRAGQRENVLPGRAVATVNLRLDPRDELEEVVDHLEEIVDDEAVTIEPVGEMRSGPSPVASTDGAGFEAIEGAVGEVFGATPVAPGLLTGATDSRHFTGLTPEIYRFTPVVLDDRDLERIHGVNERIEVEAYLDLVRYYRRLFERW